MQCVCDEIPGHGLVDLKVQFGNLSLVLEEVVVADVAFNALSSWSACERGWGRICSRAGRGCFAGSGLWTFGRESGLVGGFGATSESPEAQEGCGRHGTR